MAGRLNTITAMMFFGSMTELAVVVVLLLVLLVMVLLVLLLLVLLLLVFLVVLLLVLLVVVLLVLSWLLAYIDFVASTGAVLIEVDGVV